MPPRWPSRGRTEGRAHGHAGAPRQPDEKALEELAGADPACYAVLIFHRSLNGLLSFPRPHSLKSSARSPAFSPFSIGDRREGAGTGRSRVGERAVACVCACACAGEHLGKGRRAIPCFPVVVRAPDGRAVQGTVGVGSRA